MSTLVIDTITADVIAVNSGTCTGSFSADSISANSGFFPISATVGSLNANSAVIAGSLTASSLNTNSVAIAGALTAGSVSTNSAAIAGALTTNSIDANSGAFAVSLTKGGLNVLTEGYVPPTRYYMSVSPVTITNMPSQLSLFADNPAYVQMADLSDKTEVRFLATQTVAGASSARMRVNYSTGFGVNPEDYSGSLSTAGPNGGVELNISTGNAVHDSGWLTLNSAAKAPIYLGVVVSGGNGSADPKFGPLVVEFR